MRHVRTDNFRLFPDTGDASETYARRQPLLWTSLGFISGLEEHIDLIEGQFPQPAEADDDAIEVLVSRALAEKLGLQVGEPYILFGRSALTQLPVRIAGVWQARDAADPFWFYAPKSFEESLLVPEASFVERLAPALSDEVYQAVWYLVFDGQSVRAGDSLRLQAVPGFLERVAAYLASVAGSRRPFQVFSEESWLRGATYWLFQAYGQVLEAEATVEEALNAAQRKAGDYRACVMARAAYHEGWPACLEAVDPALANFLFGPTD